MPQGIDARAWFRLCLGSIADKVAAGGDPRGSLKLFEGWGGAGLPCDTRPSNKCGRTPSPPQPSPPCPAADLPTLPCCTLSCLLFITTFAHSTCPTCTRLLSCRGWRRFGGVLRDVAAGTRCLNIAATLSASRFARVRAAAPAHPVHVSLGFVLPRRRSVSCQHWGRCLGFALVAKHCLPTLLHCAFLQHPGWQRTQSCRTPCEHWRTWRSLCRPMQGRCQKLRCRRKTRQLKAFAV